MKTRRGRVGFIDADIAKRAYSEGEKMDAAVCKKCGSNEFIESNDSRICIYCRTSYALPKPEKAKKSDISLQEDVQGLLLKCKSDPSNAKRYAILALEIDPSNAEAAKYL